jgi:hypothetical protein
MEFRFRGVVPFEINARSDNMPCLAVQEGIVCALQQNTNSSEAHNMTHLLFFCRRPPFWGRR